MKIFQIRFLMVTILSFSIIGSSILFPNSLAQEDTQVPSWVKNVAEWWADDQVSEKEFLAAIEYLISNNIISLPIIPCGVSDTSPTKPVPSWIKNNAKWWSEDLIGDTDFLNGIKYLIQKQIMSIDNKKILGDVPLEDVIFSSSWGIDNSLLAFAGSSLFEIYGVYGTCITVDSGNLVWGELSIGLDPNKMEWYNQIAVWNDPQKAAVVYPYFTSVAYTEPGFYTYFRGECDDCTTTKFAPAATLYTTSGLGHQALTMLGYTSITDIDIDKNPDILKQFDKIVMLHNEYVTRTMFDAITSHPNVIYLYPNALYAEIEVDYVEETITLIRGHNYPEPEITNGFDWEFDNTHPYEFDSDCLDMEMYKIENGWMTTCYPETVFLKNEQAFNLLKTIKDL